MKQIGVLGYGRRIGHVVNNVTAAAPDEIRVAAFYDISEQAIARVTAANPSIQLCRSADELVGRKDIDWVFIGSFNAAHSAHAIAALEAGKHVFCEKPLVTTQAQGIELLAARRRHPDPSFAVGFVLRYSAFYRTMKRWVDEGRLGELISLEFNETLAPQHGAAMHGNWRRRSEWSGPMILEKCCHDMDLLCWLTGSRPKRVASFGGLRFFTAKNAHYNDRYPVGPKGFRFYDRGMTTGYTVGEEKNITPFSDDKDTIDHQVAILELESGVNASFHFCMHGARQERRFFLCGSLGAIRGDVLTGELEYTSVGWTPETETVRPIDGDEHGGGERPMARDIVECMLRGAPMPTTLENGLQASFICLALDEARVSGKVVDMKPYWDALV